MCMIGSGGQRYIVAVAFRDVGSINWSYPGYGREKYIKSSILDMRQKLARCVHCVNQPVLPNSCALFRHATLWFGQSPTWQLRGAEQYLALLHLEQVMRVTCPDGTRPQNEQHDVPNFILRASSRSTTEVRSTMARRSPATDHRLHECFTSSRGLLPSLSLISMLPP